MEKIYSIFQNLFNKEHRIGRKDYFLTLIIYNIIVYVFTGIVVSGYSLLLRQDVEWIITSIITFVLCLPLYTTQYHRIADTGVSKGVATVFPVIGLLLKTLRIILSIAGPLSASALFGGGTLGLLSGLSLDPESKFYTLTAIFMLVEAIYMLANFILIITKTNQFGSKGKE